MSDEKISTIEYLKLMDSKNEKRFDAVNKQFDAVNNRLDKQDREIKEMGDTIKEINNKVMAIEAQTKKYKKMKGETQGQIYYIALVISGIFLIAAVMFFGFSNYY